MSQLLWPSVYSLFAERQGGKKSLILEVCFSKIAILMMTCRIIIVVFIPFHFSVESNCVFYTGAANMNAHLVHGISHIKVIEI